MVKDRCRREMNRLETEVQRAKALSADYKKIVSDHSKRIDEFQKKYDDEKKLVTSRVSGCDKCSTALSDWLVESPRKRNSNGILSASSSSPDSPDGGGPTLTIVDLMSRLEEKQQEVHEIEMELAETKLALVQALCHNQELVGHQMSASMSSESGTKPAWFKKTISSIREVSTSFKSAQNHNNINGHTTPVTTIDH
jgi:hypothetical protein